MKKLISPESNGGVPIYMSDIINLQDEAWKGILGPLSIFDSDVQGVAVSGCVATGSSTLVITAGHVYLNGELMYFPGTGSIAAPAFIVPDTVANQARVFNDGTTHNVTVTKNAKAMSGSAPGGTQYIKIDTDAIVNTYLRAFTAKITPTLKKVINIGAWNMQGGSSKTVAHGLAFAKIVQVGVYIINDAATTKLPLIGNDQGLSGSDVNGTHETDATNITMWSTSTGSFGGTSLYSSTGASRGFIIIDYLP